MDRGAPRKPGKLPCAFGTVNTDISDRCRHLWMSGSMSHPFHLRIRHQEQLPLTRCYIPGRLPPLRFSIFVFHSCFAVSDGPRAVPHYVTTDVVRVTGLPGRRRLAIRNEPACTQKPTQPVGAMHWYSACSALQTWGWELCFAWWLVKRDISPSSASPRNLLSLALWLGFLFDLR